MYHDKLPSKTEIFEHWKNRIFEHGLFIDWGEPSCWACGFHYGSKYDIKDSTASIALIYRGWEKMPLQRCHIIHRSLGGTDEVNNLFLMCRECHDLAPNTSIRNVFFRWAKGQDYHDREIERRKQAIASFGVEEEEIKLLYTVMLSDGFKNWSADRIGLHFPQNKYASKSFRLTNSTLIGLAQYYIENELQEDRTE